MITCWDTGTLGSRNASTRGRWDASKPALECYAVVLHLCTSASLDPGADAGLPPSLGGCGMPWSMHCSLRRSTGGSRPAATSARPWGERPSSCSAWENRYRYR